MNFNNVSDETRIGSEYQWQHCIHLDAYAAKLGHPQYVAGGGGGGATLNSKRNVTSPFLKSLNHVTAENGGLKVNDVDA